MESRRILLVEDELAMRIGMQQTLSTAGYEVDAYEDAESALQTLRSVSFELLITDVRLPGMSGFDLLDQVHELYPNMGTILITAYAEVELAVKAMRGGAYDFLCKPFSNDGLLIAVERYFNFCELSQQNQQLKAEKGLEDMVGGPAMQEVFNRIRAVADSCVPVLIQGASGTGKELVANALHRLSSRRNNEFLKINCAALPELLLESELFGHEKGAYTGAHNRRIGKFEAANKGTFFFDEIGDMPLALQAKLLRVLEDGEITRLGGNVPVKVDVRVIFATATDIEEAVARGEFREDLSYRINVVPVRLPALRERGDDIIALIDHFLRESSQRYGKPDTVLSPQAAEALRLYDYPGNIRELRNVFERAVLLAQDGVIRLGHLPRKVQEHGAVAELCRDAEKGLGLEEGVHRYERNRIIDALEKAGGRKQRTAESLGISRKVLWKKMKDLNIS
ncbi:sigma-54-dependent transcriptional regulator [Desulfosediminicola ganghwensis]|uniref:sigma-54-dependent transcriptional regulator n=1 Tax=Desulfosediminicola ganghwensis TaxID=2569540 RepID=UPI0010AD3575|nr:sigma-54 dependent transcriptional regulator [Desulfosediminicola ganghwensis]